MLGAGLQFGRSRGGGEDWFYNHPARARRNFQDKQQQKHQENLRRAQSDVTVSQTPVASPVSREPDNGAASTVEPPKKDAVPPLEPVASPLCNLDRFLESVTPSVPAQYLSKTTMRGWSTCDVESQPYFVLDDLWESFKEWSAYGAGVPLVMNESDCVVQYYVPYLSGIQIYGDPLKCSVKSSKRPGEDSDGDSFRDSSSDGSSDCEHERGCFNYSGKRNHHNITTEIPLRMDRMSLADQNTALQEGFSSDEGESGNSQGCLLFEYLERDQPYSREPLADKILDLALRFPELKTLRSCDILSSSWISVAWYPIYRIPTGPTLNNLDACFLTFHSLHSDRTQSVRPSSMAYPKEIDGIPKISLPVFGLATYKFKTSLWTPNGGSDRQLVKFFLEAENLLTMLHVKHPDFIFFSRR